MRYSSLAADLLSRDVRQKLDVKADTPAATPTSDSQPIKIVPKGSAVVR